VPPRELLENRLAGRDVKDTNDLQGIMIWFLINTNVSDSA